MVHIIGRSEHKHKFDFFLCLPINTKREPAKRVVAATLWTYLCGQSGELSAHSLVPAELCPFHVASGMVWWREGKGKGSQVAGPSPPLSAFWGKAVSEREDLQAPVFSIPPRPHAV